MFNQDNRVRLANIKEIKDCFNILNESIRALTDAIVEVKGLMFEINEPAINAARKRKQKEMHERFFAQSVQKLNISRGIANALSRAGIYTIGQLIHLTWKDLLKIKGVGRGSAGEISYCLERKGLRLGTKPDEGNEVDAHENTDEKHIENE